MKASSILARSGAALAALTVVGAASAASIQFSISDYSHTTDWSITQSVTKFDPMLGTLLSVDFSVTAGMYSDITLANLSDQSTANLTGNVTTSYSLKDVTGNLTYLSGGLTVTKSDTDFAVNPTQSFGDGPWKRYYDHTTTPALNSSQTFGTNSSNPATLLAFTRTSPLDTSISLLVAASGTSTSTSNNGNSRITYATTASTGGFVRYNYVAAPVPEPSSIAALGLGAVAMIRRRKAGKAVAR